MVPIKAPNLVKCAVGYAGLYDLVGRFSQDGIKGDTQLTNWFAYVYG